MSHRKAFLAVVVAPLLAGQLLLVLDDKPKRRPAPVRIKPTAPARPVPIVYAPAPTMFAPAPLAYAPDMRAYNPIPLWGAAPDYSLQVHGDIRFPGDQAWLPRKVSEILNQAGIGVPEERVRYFRGFAADHPGCLRPGGWDGAIEAVTPIEGGIIVDLAVTASYGRLHDSATLMERYTIINGVVRYVRCWAPKNRLRWLVSA